MRVFYLNLGSLDINLGNFSAISKSELIKLFICEVEVCILETFCNYRFSVSSKFLVIYAWPNLSTFLRKSSSGSRMDDGCDSFFFIDIISNWR